MRKQILTRDKSFYRSMIALAIPIALQSLITFAVNFADNIMIGTLGDAAVSGVYIGNQVQTVLQMLTDGISGAMLVLAAQYWGKKDVETIRKVVALAMRWVMVVGVVFTAGSLLAPRFLMRLFTRDATSLEQAVPYFMLISCSYLFFCISQVLIASMRSVENAKIGMKISIVALFVNIGLNYLLIFGKLGLPALGVIGAGIATLIARIVEAVIIAIYVKIKDDKLRLELKDLTKFSKVLRRDYIRYGVPIIMGGLVWSCNMLANTMILGQYNAEVITASSMTGMMNTLVYIWVMGLSAAVGIIIGKTVGAGEVEKVKEYARTTEVLFLCMGIITGGIVQLIKRPFMSLYRVSEGALHYANQFMNVLSLSIMGSSYQAACLGGLVKAGGDTGFMFKNDTIFVFGVVLPSAFITSKLGAPVWVVFVCLKIDQWLKCIVAFFKINSFNWIKNITRENVDG